MIDRIYLVVEVGVKSHCPLKDKETTLRLFTISQVIVFVICVLVILITINTNEKKGYLHNNLMAGDSPLFDWPHMDASSP